MYQTEEGTENREEGRWSCSNHIRFLPSALPLKALSRWEKQAACGSSSLFFLLVLGAQGVRMHARTHMHHVLIDAPYMLSQVRDRWSQRQPFPPPLLPGHFVFLHQRNISLLSTTAPYHHYHHHDQTGILSARNSTVAGSVNCENADTTRQDPALSLLVIQGG